MPATRDAALHRIRLRHLQCFLAVAEARNLRRAAEALAVSQPAVTKTLNELEDILGVRLFERGRRGAQPTPEAEVFLRHANASVQSLSDAVDSMLRGRGEAVPLRIGALPTVAPSVLARALQAFRSERPAAELRVLTGRNAQLLAQLRARELDAVVGRMADPDDMVGLTFELLYSEPLALVLRAGHPLLRGKRRAPAAAAIGQYPLVLPLAGTIIRHGAEGFLRAHGIVPRQGVTETLSVALSRALVLQGDALWLTPLSAAEPDVDSGALVRLPLHGAGSEEPVGLLLRNDTPPTAALQALVGAVRREAAARRATLRDALR
jgi:LysR family transcriptional regulator, pca operon transcriptional activator